MAVVGLVFGFCLKTIAQARKVGIKSFRPAWYEGVLLVCGFAGVCCIIYAVLEPYMLGCTFVVLRSPKLTRDARLRIVHITDLHCDGFKRTDKKLVKTIAELKPDLIVFSGDAANTPLGLNDFRDCMKQLSAVAKTFGVTGNNDLRGEDVFTGTGVVRLDGQGEGVIVKGQPVWVNGVGADRPEQVEQAMSKAPARSLDVFLYHYPAAILAKSVGAIDLLCTGHTHGGQVRLPFYGALLTNSDVGKQFEYGLYKAGRTNMFVSRGVGTNVLPIRFLAPPEVAVIDVVPE